MTFHTRFSRWVPIAVLGLGLLVLTCCGHPSHFGIVFASNNDGNREIYRMTSDGRNVERLTYTPDYNEQVVRVSPDGSRIIFDRGGGRLERDIYLLDVDTGDISQLTDPRTSPTYDMAGDWSPDGSQIAFISDRDGGYYWLYLMNPDGSNIRHISLATDPDRRVESVSWSPDGHYLVYGTSEHVHARVVLTPTLFIVNLETQEVTQLTDEGQHGACFAPDWSPDGDWIAMVCTKGTSAGDYGEIYIIRPDGSDFRHVTTLPEGYTPDLPMRSFLTWVREPRWSPDGTQIVYAATVDGTSNIYIIGANGKRNRRLTDYALHKGAGDLSVYELP